jgi:hypothetical protein
VGQALAVGEVQAVAMIGFDMRLRCLKHRTTISFPTNTDLDGVHPQFVPAAPATSLVLALAEAE